MYKSWILSKIQFLFQSNKNVVWGFQDNYNTLFNKSQAWHIDGINNKKNPYDFYKVLTF